jgi:hypothetical protein
VSEHASAADKKGGEIGGLVSVATHGEHMRNGGKIGDKIGIPKGGNFVQNFASWDPKISLWKFHMALFIAVQNIRAPFTHCCTRSTELHPASLRSPKSNEAGNPWTAPLLAFACR